MNVQLNKLMSIGIIILAILGCQPVPSTAPIVGDSAALTLTSLLLTLTAPPVTPTPLDAADVSATSPTFPADGFPTATELPPSVVEPSISPPTLPPPTIATVAGPNNPAPAPAVPMVSVTNGTSCRSGPGEAYANVGDVPAGGRFVLTGKNTPRSYWILRLPSGSECWLPGGYAVVEGNVASLPEYAVPPEPVPVPQVGLITGRVIWSGPARIEGQLFPRIEVKVTTNTTESSQMTNEDDGTYTFHDVPAGPVIVSFTNTATLSTSNRFTVTLRAGQTWEAPVATVTATIPSGNPPTSCPHPAFCGVSLPTLQPPAQRK